MASQHGGAQPRVDQGGTYGAQPPQIDASLQPRNVKAPTPAAFGGDGGAAVVIRDYASI